MALASWVSSQLPPFTTYSTATLGHFFPLNVPITFPFPETCLCSTGSVCGHTWLLPLLGFKGKTTTQSGHNISAGLDSDSESSAGGSWGLLQWTGIDMETSPVFHGPHGALTHLPTLKSQAVFWDPDPKASLPWCLPHLPAYLGHFPLETAHCLYFRGLFVCCFAW